MGRLVDSATWEALDVEAGGAGQVRKRVAPLAPIDIFAAVEKPSGARLMLFRLATASDATLIDIPTATGIKVAIVPTADAGWGFAEARLLDPRYADIFTSLADDLAEHVASSRDGRAAVERLADRLRRWQAFLELADPEGLSQERRAGLYGELHVIREYLWPALGESAIDAWVGPASAQQDFQAPGWALEVKTSRVKLPSAVVISGERQLDDLGLTYLGLAHVGLEQRRQIGETLPAIVRSVRALVHDLPVAETFEAQLIGAGYLAVHEPLYEDDGYTVRFDELFRVRDAFPRITERDLIAGVGAVHYSIFIAALEPYRDSWGSVSTMHGQAEG